MENTAKLIRRLFFPANQYLRSGSLQQERDAVISVILVTYLPFRAGGCIRPTGNLRRKEEASALPTSTIFLSNLYTDPDESLHHKEPPVQDPEKRY